MTFQIFKSGHAASPVVSCYNPYQPPCEYLTGDQLDEFSRCNDDHPYHQAHAGFLDTVIQGVTWPFKKAWQFLRWTVGACEADSQDPKEVGLPGGHRIEQSAGLLSTCGTDERIQRKPLCDNPFLAEHGVLSPDPIATWI